MNLILVTTVRSKLCGKPQFSYGILNPARKYYVQKKESSYNQHKHMLDVVSILNESFGKRVG